MEYKLNNFENDLINRRRKIAILLSSLFLLILVLGLLFNSVTFIQRLIIDERLSDQDVLIIFSITILTALMLFIRIYISKYSVRKGFLALSFIITFFSLYGLTTTGTFTLIPYLLIITVALSESIIFSIKFAFKYIFIVSILILLIMFLQINNIIEYNPEASNTEFVSTIVIIAILGTIVYILYIAYGQIDYYYEKSTLYYKDLNNLNSNLKEHIKKNTKKLKRTLERESEAIHQLAVIGQITQPMVHDLATPISSIKGLALLLEEQQKEAEDIDKDLVSHLNSSVEQLESIINTSQQLMHGRSSPSFFSPHNEITGILNVIQDKLNKGNIQVKTKVNKKIEIYGISNLFTRIISNIILNACEALITSPNKNKKQISIECFEQKDNIKIIIEDNGKGIPEKDLKNIFKSFYSKKSDNIGIGLYFVKNAIQKYFHGSIKVESKEKKFTKFIMTFKKNYELDQ